MQTGDWVAVTGIVAGMLVVMTLSVWVYREWKTRPVPIESPLVEKPKIENEILAVEEKLNNAAAAVKELGLRLGEKRSQLFDPGPEPTKPPWWTDLLTHTIGGPVFISPSELIYWGLYGKWRLNKAAYDRLNNEIAELGRKLESTNSDVVRFSKEKDLKRGRLEEVQKLVASLKMKQFVAFYAEVAWNDWIRPFLHVMLLFASAMVTLRIAFRLVLLRQWIGVGRV